MSEQQTAEVALPSPGLARMLEPYRDRCDARGWISGAKSAATLHESGRLLAELDRELLG